MARFRSLVVVAAVVLTACGAGDNPTVSGAGALATSTTTSPTTVATTATTSTSTTTTLPPTTTTLPPVRVVTEQDWLPLATVGGVVVSHPSRRVEHVGFHQSNHDGAQQLEPLPTAVAPVTLETREARDTGPRGAADVVVDPDVEIRAPATGTVLRGGGYTLYCDYRDDFLVIEPDDHPGWEVKILHINGVLVGRGDRVVAGETVIAPGPTVLPFESQVDELRTVEPAWPHVHIEVVDPSIPDRPTPGGGCS